LIKVQISSAIQIATKRSVLAKWVAPKSRSILYGIFKHWRLRTLQSSFSYNQNSNRLSMIRKWNFKYNSVVLKYSIAEKYWRRTTIDYIFRIWKLSTILKASTTFKKRQKLRVCFAKWHEPTVLNRKPRYVTGNFRLEGEKHVKASSQADKISSKHVAMDRAARLFWNGNKISHYFRLWHSIALKLKGTNISC
jgi:hypothetical protein